MVLYILQFIPESSSLRAAYAGDGHTDLLFAICLISVLCIFTVKSINTVFKPNLVLRTHVFYCNPSVLFAFGQIFLMCYSITDHE